MPRKPTGKPNGRTPFKPTDDDRKTVSLMAAVGIPHEGIALCVRDGIDDKTLRKHFAKELKTAAIKANAKVAGTMYKSALAGNMSAAIWWTKARMRWTEKQEVEHSGAMGVVDMTVDEYKQARLEMLGDDDC